MKILYIITQAESGGAQKYVLSLAKYFGGAIAAGDLLGKEDGYLFDQAKAKGLKTFRLKCLKRSIHPFWDILAIFEIRKLIKTYDPDIVHLNSSKAGFLGSLATALLFHPAKIIFTAHGFILNEPLSPATKKTYLLMEKLASLFRDYTICVSQNDYNSAITHHLAKKTEISTIYNGIGTINFLGKPEARSSLGLPQDKIIIGCIANLYKTKGLDILISAVGMLDQKIREKILVAVIGDGPEREDLKSKIQSLKLESVLILLGKIDAANRYLKAFDFFVMPSRKEGFPFALLEAMQAGLPIIASGAGGIPEALLDAGFLVKPGDPKELSMVISKIASDFITKGPAYFDEIIQKTKERSKVFNEEKMLEETKKIYEFVLKKPSPSHLTRPA